MDTDLDAELDSDQDYEMDDEEGLESMRTMATEMSCDDLESLQKVPEFPAWTTCWKRVEYIKFPINFPIMESKKTFCSQTVLEFGIPTVSNKTIRMFENIRLCI